MVCRFIRGILVSINVLVDFSVKDFVNYTHVIVSGVINLSIG